MRMGARLCARWRAGATRPSGGGRRGIASSSCATAPWRPTPTWSAHPPALALAVWRLAGGLPERQALFSRITLRAASTVQAAGGDSVGLGPSDVQGHNCARLALTQVAALLRAGLGPVVEELEKEMLLTALGKDLYALG